MTGQIGAVRSEAVNFYGRPAAGDPEHRRLVETRDGRANWRRWGRILADRQWGTVREDYSEDGDAVGRLAARRRAFARLSLGRGRPARDLRRAAAGSLRARALERSRPDPQGAAVRADRHRRATTARTSRRSTPTSTRRRPDRPSRRSTAIRRREFPYGDLVAENARRGREAPEYELADTGVLDDDRFFDVVIEYAKAGPEDILIRIAATNRGPERRRSTCCRRSGSATPGRGVTTGAAPIGLDRTAGTAARARPRTGGWATTGSPCDREAPWLFTDNETNTERLLGTPNRDAVRQGRVPRGGRRGSAGRRQPGRHRDEGRGARTSWTGRRRRRAVRLRLRARARRRRRSRTPTCVLGARPRRRGRVLRPPLARTA